jgi:uncharacterized protein YebE (UPF0316 family)
MNLAITPDVVGFALVIFALRVVNYSISTVRLVFIARGRRVSASVIAFFEALIFAVVIAQVVSDLENVVYLLAYCLGAAVGSYVGMWLDSRYVVSYSKVTVITRELGEGVAAALRDMQFGATLSWGEGRDGRVAIVHSSVVTRDIPSLVSVVREVDPDSFIDVEPVSTLQRGWLPGGPARRAR